MRHRRRVQGHGVSRVPEVRQHINYQIPPLAHTPMYVWHKFWGRKTWNVVAEYIRTYCPEGGVVLDPFAGSGVVAMEALKNGRRAIVCDLLPIATEITRLTIQPVDTERLQEAFARVAEKVKDKIVQLYHTRCRRCRFTFPFTCAVWEDTRMVEIRYRKCPQCGDRREAGCRPNQYDRRRLREIDEMSIDAWYPTHRLYYPDGTPFKKKERYESLDQLFTKRNLMALAWLMEAIEEETDRNLRDFLKIAFTSMVHLCTKMVPAIRPTPGSHQTPFSSTWTQHSYWSVSRFMEQNVWQKFERAVIGHQGLLKAKEESNQYFSHVRFARRIEDVIRGQADVYIHCGDALELMQAMHQQGVYVDYIFTDPPYDAAIQYGELAYLWIAWLKKDANYLETLIAREIIRNERQNKDFDVYHALLRRAFTLMFDVLKPGGYLTVTFHNPTFRVRNATIYAGVMAGFEFEKIHHQPLGQVSAKAMLQPFGSAQGDFYLRFRKPVLPAAEERPEVIDEWRFERIVIETATRVIAQRGEPTPYTILINAIDPELARNGYFTRLRTGLDVQTVLKHHIGKEFVLVPMQIGNTRGEAWWFRDPGSIPHLQSVPLSERVEQAVLRQLQARGRVTFTDVWRFISEEFPNALTTDTVSIREALQTYARPVHGGEWLLKPAFHIQVSRRTHTRIIAILAELGKSRGYDVWIGRREQADPLQEAFPRKKGHLRDYVTLASLTGIQNVHNVDAVEQIDVVWVQGSRIQAIFEVEITTSMTEALRRGASVASDVPKYLVIPQDRETQLLRKMQSPLFGDRFQKDNWQYFFCETLEYFYAKNKKKLNVETLVGQRVSGISSRDNPWRNQPVLII